MNMGERIELKRKEKNMTMEELADRLGVGRSAVNKWEKGTVKTIKREVIGEMAKIFECNPAWLLCYTDDDRPYKTFNSPEEYELAWYRNGGGRHPIELSDLEHEIILAFRSAGSGRQESILRLLDIEVKEKNQDVG